MVYCVDLIMLLNLVLDTYLFIPKHQKYNDMTHTKQTIVTQKESHIRSNVSGQDGNLQRESPISSTQRVDQVYLQEGMGQLILQ